MDAQRWSLPRQDAAVTDDPNPLRDDLENYYESISGLNLYERTLPGFSPQAEALPEPQRAEPTGNPNPWLKKDPPPLPPRNRLPSAPGGPPPLPPRNRVPLERYSRQLSCETGEVAPKLIRSNTVVHSHVSILNCLLNLFCGKKGLNYQFFHIFYT